MQIKYWRSTNMADLEYFTSTNFGRDIFGNLKLATFAFNLATCELDLHFPLSKPRQF